MNTLEIDTLLKKHPHSRPVFKGVYARNRLPRLLNVPSALVGNTDPDHMATGCDQRLLEPLQGSLGVSMRNWKLCNTRSDRRSRDPFGSVIGVFSTTSASYSHRKFRVPCYYYQEKSAGKAGHAQNILPVRTIS
jgi:hypothetical protein